MPDDAAKPAPRNGLAVQLSRKIICMLVDDLNSEEMRTTLHGKMVRPLLDTLTTHLRPYLLAVLVMLCINASLALLTFLVCVLFYLRR